MCKVIAVANQKGGVGKTVTSVNLGVGLYGQYADGETKPRKSIRESLKENKKKVEESKKKTKSKSRNFKYSERE